MTAPVATDRPWDALPDFYARKLSGGKWKPYRHLTYLAETLSTAIMGGNGRVLVQMPPRVGKSETASFWTPLWFLDQFPAQRVILASYTKDIALVNGRKIRNELAQNPLARSKLAEDSKSVGHFHTREGGGLFCAGIGSALIGIGGHLVVFDDPYAGWAEAFSSTNRRATEEWFFSTLMSRLEPNATVFVVGHRFHPSDLHGVLEKMGGWGVVRMPAIADGPDAIGRKAGDPLCPERFDTAAWEEKRKSCKSDARWTAIYLQAPTGEGTGRLYQRFSARNEESDLVLDEALPLHVSFDFNINPGMHVIIGQYRETDRVFIATDEIHTESMDLNGALDTFARWIGARGGFKFPEAHVFGDATGHARSVQATRSCYDMIAQKLGSLRVPFRVRVPRQQPPLRDSIDAVNDALLGMDGVPRYFVHPRCERLLADYRELMRAADGLIDKSDRLLSHASDAERYRVFMVSPAGRGDAAERPRAKGRIFVAPAPAA